MKFIEGCLENVQKNRYGMLEPSVEHLRKINKKSYQYEPTCLFSPRNIKILNTVESKTKEELFGEEEGQYGKLLFYV
jgi:hypothetical protein